MNIQHVGSYGLKDSGRFYYGSAWPNASTYLFRIYRLYCMTYMPVVCLLCSINRGLNKHTHEVGNQGGQLTIGKRCTFWETEMRLFGFNFTGIDM